LNSREPRSSAFSRKTSSPLRSYAARRPPRLRMVVSKPETAPTWSWERWSLTQSRPSQNSSFMPMSHSVSSESTRVVPMPPQLLVALPLMGCNSSLPNACSL